MTTGTSKLSGCRYALLLTALLLTGWATARGERLPLKAYTTANGLAHNVVNKIVRDSRGFLWFCTNEGLARARVVRLVAEHPTLVEQEFNRAFVLMQYLGYRRRNPTDPPEGSLDFQGYNFWLTKLNQFNGNFIDAEMVKAFIVSGEYRQRFGP